VRAAKEIDMNVCLKTRLVLVKGVLSIAGLAGLISASLAAQQPAARVEPNPLGQPLVTATGEVRDDAIIRIPLLPEDKKYADLDGRRLKAFLMEVDAISLKDRDTGNLFWGRNVGTPGHVATQDWVEGYFRKNGLTNISRQALDLEPQWVPKSYDISFTSAGKTYKLKSARPASRGASTPTGGIELDLIWVGGGTAADFIGRDVKGKAVLIQDTPLPGELRHSIAIEGAVQRAFEKGAAAVGIVYGISDNFAIWQRVAGGPGFNLGFEDGKILRDLLGAGQTVKVHYRLESEMRPGLKTAHVWGTLPGTTDEDITIIAHMDGYFRSALDNGSGLAVMMGLVEHFAKVPQAQRRRNIRFMGSAGHHGGPGARYLHDAKETALAKTVLAINLEHVAAVRTKYWGNKLRMTTGVSPMRWWVWGSPRLLDIAVKSFNRFNVGITADMDPGASGEMGSVARDVPSMQVITSPEIKHTEEDTPEWIPSAGLEQVARAYARIIDEVNKLDRKDVLPAGTKSTDARH
jgi:hypothetical protein